LVEHTELDVACRRGDDEVERVSQDGCVGDAGDSSEVEEGEGLFESEEDTNGGEEQVALVLRSVKGRVFKGQGCVPSLLPLCALT